MLGKALKEGEKIIAAHEQIRVERASNAANNVSFVFEFHYCHLTPRTSPRQPAEPALHGRGYSPSAAVLVVSAAAEPPERTRRTRRGARMRAIAASA